jgi:serine/threonine protein kinase
VFEIRIRVLELRVRILPIYQCVLISEIVYMAPEVITENSYSKASDVFAFGIILHELYTKEHPYSHSVYGKMHVTHLSYQIAHKGVRPDCSLMPPILRELVLDCWSDSPLMRPMFREIISRLKRIAKMNLQPDKEDVVLVDLISEEANELDSLLSPSREELHTSSLLFQQNYESIEVAIN